MTASDPNERHDYEVDDLFEIAPRLVSGGADLSQYRWKSLPQTTEDMLAIEESILSPHIGPAVNTPALAPAGPLQSLRIRQESPRTLVPTPSKLP